MKLKAVSFIYAFVSICICICIHFLEANVNLVCSVITVIQKAYFPYW